MCDMVFTSGHPPLCAPNLGHSKWSQRNGNADCLRTSIQLLFHCECFSVVLTRTPLDPQRPGKFAVVRKCMEKSTGHEYAAKFMRKRRKGQDCRVEIIHEIAVLELATASPRVVNLHQVYEMASEMVLVLE
ncbi:hypothetical protein GOODEAATRI_013703 [Goodea atripinnis]|uniref:Protein kinase domain-containing protein n=1 Tax=Goodea atripinnis TaxID=208336 RepID=A0ABV0NK15_9TELE